MGFCDNIHKFLLEEQVPYEFTSPNVFIFKDFNLKIFTIELTHGDALTMTRLIKPEENSIYLYEDIWLRNNEFIKKRILAHLGKFQSIFARKCNIKRISTPIANDFLDKCHFYGKVKAKYKYGIFYKEDLVAVACFSSARNIPRVIGNSEQILRSYEWVRYASLPNYRIVGGMGKVLSAFINDVCPQEIMTYADLEWSQGKTYRNLGFEEAGYRTPITFYLSSKNFERLRKPEPNSIEFQNLGSIKYLMKIERHIKPCSVL